MRKNVVSALDLYRRLVGIQIRSQFQYRISFLLDVMGQGFATGLWFCSLALVMQRFKQIAGWSLGEVAFLYGTVEIAFGTMDMIFSGFDPDNFSEVVRRGSFDQLLIRPINITLQVLGSKFTLRRVGRILEGLAVFGVALSLTPIHWTFPKLLYLPVVLSSLVCFYAGMFIIGSTISFWTIQSVEAINIFTYGGSEMISYPMSIYPAGLRNVFTYIVPAIFLNYFPALYILDKPDPLGFPSYAPFLSPLVGIGTLLSALAFWHYGIRHYQSTGS